MIKINKHFCLLSGLVLIQCFSYGQYINKNTFLQYFDTSRSKDLTSLKTNVLAEILQASINSGIISTKGTDIAVKSTIFQLKKLWKPGIIIDSNYKKQTFARNFEFGFGIKVSNSNKINGFGSAIKYAIINRRDVSMQDDANIVEGYKATEASIAAVMDKIHVGIALKIENAINDTLFKLHDPQGTKLNSIYGALKTFSDSSSNPNSLKNLGIALDPYIGILGLDKSAFEIFQYTETIDAIKKHALDLEEVIKKRALLTINFSSNYKERNWDSLSLSLEYIKGLGNKKGKDKPWDFYAAAFCDFKLDTVTKNALGRQIFTAKIGLNKVLLKNGNENNSFLEILGNAEFDHVLKGLYSKEIKDVFMADFTLSIRLSPTLFLPLEIKYDPKNANLFGFLKIKWDLPRTNDKK